MNEKVYREKSLNKIKSPDSLDDYIKVSGPGVWMLLAAAIILIAGFLVWGVFGHMGDFTPISFLFN